MAAPSRSSSSASSSPTPPIAPSGRRAWAKRILGTGFALGPGGKGSNQAVAAARLGADVSFITRLGQDPFADMAMKTWTEAGVKPAVIATPESYTGAAYIFIEEGTGNNAIIVAPGAAALISPADIDANAELIRSAVGVRDAARAAARCGDPRAGDRQGGGRDDDPQPGAGGGSCPTRSTRFATM